MSSRTQPRPHHNGLNGEALRSRQTSRIPTKPSSIGTSNRSESKAQDVSRLPKRSSRSLLPVEIQTKSSRSPREPISAQYGSAGSSNDRSTTAVSTSAPQRLSLLSPPPTIRTPSLVSGSSVSTFDSPRSSALRRKPSSAIDHYAAQKRAGQSINDGDRTLLRGHADIYAESNEDVVFGTFFGEHVAGGRTRDTVSPYEEEIPIGVIFNATPPLAMYAPSMTPSTRYTDSPFSHVATPSSASSISSSIAATSHSAVNAFMPSPQKRRPSLSARSASKDETLRLAPVRESSTSSSNKTVRPSTSKSKSPPTKQSAPRKVSTTVSPTKTGGLRKQSSRNRLVKEPPSASAGKRNAQNPPELAHLDIDTSSKSEGKTIAPARPSRDGTSSILDIGGPAPVVQSDLPKLYTGYHKRTPSQDTPESAGSSSLRSRFGLSSKSSIRNDSPRIDSAMSPQSVTKPFNRGSTPDNASNDNLHLERKDSPAVSIGKSSTKSQRFGFFSRKSKSEGAKVLEKPRRPTVKGPAAGTGHEGYGRFGIRGRSSSSLSSIGVRSPSTDSNVSNMPTAQARRNISMSSKDSTDLDDFLRERLNPVVLRGSGIAPSVASTVISLTPQEPGSEQASTNVSPRSSYAKPQLLPSAMQKSKSTSLSKRPILDRRLSSDISDDDSRSIFRPSGTRRAAYRLSQTSTASSPGREFSVGSRRVPMKPGSVDSYDDEILIGSMTSNLVDASNNYSHGEEGLWLRSGPPEPVKRPSRKFPFFQRAQSSPRRSDQNKVTTSPASLSFSEQAISLTSVAHYGMPETVEPVGLEEVARMVREGEMSPGASSSERTSISSAFPPSRRHSYLPVSEKSRASGDGSVKSTTTPTIRVQLQRPTEGAVLINAPKTHTRKAASTSGIARPVQKSSSRDARTSAVRTPDMRPNMNMPESGVLVATPEQLAPESSPRPPRLSPVGRIPRVVSKRDRDRKLPDNSFSRPFAQSQPRPSVKPPGSVYNQIREMASPVEGVSHPISSTSGRSESTIESRKSGTFTSAPSLSTGRTSVDLHAQNEFLAFPSRKGSDQSYSTSSGSQSWYITAHAQSKQQDDIWNEYNDLMDEILPRGTPVMPSSFERPAQPYNGFGDSSSAPYYLPPISGAPPSIDLPLPPSANSVPNIMSMPHQIARFLQPSLSPLISESLSAFISGYSAAGTNIYPPQNRVSANTSGVPEPRRSSTTSIRRASLTSSRNSQLSGHSRASSLPEVLKRSSRSSVSGPIHASTTQLADIAEVTPIDPAKSKSLRYGAMMTSKWLSFGRVLFSPAHHELQLADEPRVLIVDGLGSDWSYYVALTYKMASVYNLCPDSLSSPTSSWPDPEQKAPRNHFQIPFSGLASPIPFPKGFFNAVVFRFPISASEDAYKFFVSECKRVLRPGGFLEVGVLDLDLVNMGNNMRKAVRDLKTRIQRRDQNLCLQNLSDVLIRLIGRRGFDDVQRCIVGVPAVGRIPRSQDLSSASSDDLTNAIRPLRRYQKSGEESEDLQFSFADLLDDSATLQFVPGNGANDESITKMVAKVGRWWYSTCYEQVDNTIQHTIWSDRSLLQECERNGTSFRLLICHAQKPSEPRRRTVSV